MCTMMHVGSIPPTWDRTAMCLPFYLEILLSANVRGLNRVRCKPVM
jgi:hypothetical protein